MMEIYKKYQKIILALIILVLAFIAYSFLKGSGSKNNISNALVSSVPSASVSDNQVAPEFFNQLLTLQKIRLNATVFSDTRFQSLQDFSQPIPDEPQGRPNPFAPIGTDVGTVSATSSP